MIDTTHDLLRELRAEVQDWADALCGERDGLDDLLARTDRLIASPVIAIDFDPATADLAASCIGVGIEGADDHPEETIEAVEEITVKLRDWAKFEVEGVA